MESLFEVVITFLSGIFFLEGCASISLFLDSAFALEAVSGGFSGNTYFSYLRQNSMCKNEETECKRKPVQLSHKT